MTALAHLVINQKLRPTIPDRSFLTPKHRYAQCAKHHQENKKQSKHHVPKLLNNWTEASNNFPIRSFTPQRPCPNFWANILFCGLKMVPSHYGWDFHCLSRKKTEQLKDTQTMPQGFLTFFSFKYEKKKTKPHRLIVYRYWIFFSSSHGKLKRNLQSCSLVWCFWLFFFWKRVDIMENPFLKVSRIKIFATVKIKLDSTNA